MTTTRRRGSYPGVSLARPRRVFRSREEATRGDTRRVPDALGSLRCPPSGGRPRAGGETWEVHVESLDASLVHQVTVDASGPLAPALMVPHTRVRVEGLGLGVLCEGIILEPETQVRGDGADVEVLLPNRTEELHLSTTGVGWVRRRPPTRRGCGGASPRPRSPPKGSALVRDETPDGDGSAYGSEAITTYPASFTVKIDRANKDAVAGLCPSGSLAPLVDRRQIVGDVLALVGKVVERAVFAGDGAVERGGDAIDQRTQRWPPFFGATGALFTPPHRSPGRAT